MLKLSVRAFRYLVVAALAGTVTGCAFVVQAKGMTVTNLDSNAGDTSLLHRGLTVTKVSGGTPAALRLPAQISDEELTVALTQSLGHAQLLSDGPGRYVMEVALVSLKQPASGFDMTVAVSLWCKLTDSSSGSVVFQHLVTASHTSTVSDAFVGVDRLRVATEGAARGALKALLLRLTTEKQFQKSVTVSSRSQAPLFRS
jgi:hypothetical protein